MTSENRQTSSDGLASAFPGWLKSPILALTITMFFWACTSIVVRYTRVEIPPFGLAFWRNSLATLFILPFAISIAWQQRALIRANIGILALLAALLWVGGNALLFLSLQYTIAINAAVINSVEPVLIIVAAGMLFGDRITARQAGGVVVSLLGVLVLLSGGSINRLLQLQLNVGDLIVFCAYVFWSLYAVLLRKLPRQLDSRAMLLVLVGLGAVFLFPMYVIETMYFRPMPFTATSISAAAGLGLLSCAVAMYFWNYAIANMGPAKAGQYLHLIPAFTIILAISLLGETIGGHHIAGIVLIVAGIVLTTRS